MSSTPHQQNRIVHKNQVDTSRLLNKHSDLFTSIKNNTLQLETLITATNTKLDSFTSSQHTNQVNTKDHIGNRIDALISSNVTGLAHLSDNNDFHNSKFDILHNDLVINATGLNNIEAQQELSLPVHQLTNTKLDTIIANTAAISIDGDAIQVNTDGLETLQGTANATLVEIKTASEAQIPTGVNRIGRIGLTANEHKDGTLTERHLVCDADGHLQVDVRAAEGSLPISGTVTANLSTNDHDAIDAILAKNTEIETSLTSMEAKQDSLISANHTDIINHKARVDVLITQNNTNQLHLSDNLDHLSSNLDTVNSNLGIIAADTTSLDTKIVACNTGQVVISSGAVTATLSTADHDAIDAILAKNTEILAKSTEIETSLTSMETKQDSLISANHTDIINHKARVDVLITQNNTNQLHLSDNLDHLSSNLDTVIGHVNGIEGLLTGIDADTDAIKTAVEIIDDAIKTEDLAHSSGDKGIPCLMVRQDSHTDLAADGDYMIPTINANGEIRVTSTAASGGATEAKQDDMETTLDAILAKNTAAETHLGNIDDDTHALKVDIAAIKVLITATNSNQGTLDTTTGEVVTNVDAGNSILTTIDTALDTIKVDTEAIETAVEKLAGVSEAVWLNNATINAGALGAALDTTGYTKIRLYGVVDASFVSGQSDLIIMGALTTGGTYFHLGQAVSQEIGSSADAFDISFNCVIESPTKFIKIMNVSGSDNYAMTINAKMTHT